MVPKEFLYVLVVRKVVRDQGCSTLFHCVGQIAEDTLPCLSWFAPAVNRFSRKWICWRVIPIEIEHAW